MLVTAKIKDRSKWTANIPSRSSVRYFSDVRDVIENISQEFVEIVFSLLPLEVLKGAVVDVIRFLSLLKGPSLTH